MERIFIDRIANSRKVDHNHIKEKFGQGAVLVAGDPASHKTDALSVKMIDGYYRAPGRLVTNEEYLNI